ncbi:hypothetical protein C0J52_22830 [Blattella germanica]|nr:hypothetical protein C0J52_22830 [Blattella germanica]
MHGPWQGNVHTREFFLCIASHLNVDGMNSFTVDILIPMLMRSFNLNMIISYGCGTWTLTLREKRLRLFENKVLRKIFGPKRDEETGEWRRLHSNELNDLYGKPDIIIKMKFHRLRWAGHVARGKRLVGRPRMKWENNINHDLREVDYTGDDWKTLAQDMDVWRAYVRTPMNLWVR